MDDNKLNREVILRDMAEKLKNKHTQLEFHLKHIGTTIIVTKLKLVLSGLKLTNI